LLETLGHERFACGFDDSGADHEALRLEVGVVHSLSVLSEIAKLPLHDLLSRMLRGEMLERSYRLGADPILTSSSTGNPSVFCGFRAHDIYGATGF
jgi:hypothetical protein